METKSFMKNIFAFLTISVLIVLNGFSQPFAIPAKLDPLANPIPQFIDPMPHFAAGLRINAKAGGSLLIKAVPVKQVALPNGTVLPNGSIIGTTPNAGLGNYLAYEIWQNGKKGIAMWPAQTIEALAGNELKIQYENDLDNLTYADFNIMADQTLMMSGYPISDQMTEPYAGPIPMVTHLHGGEIPSNSDGGPSAWFMPGNSLTGPGFPSETANVCTYPNKQESPTLWYHPHDQGLTRINVYLGMAGYYFLRQPGEDALHLPGWSGDDKVMEFTPPGKTATFNGANAYLPEVELAIQDRMFNVNGGLYWPVDEATNPDVHPFWTPEFFGDVMTVNGKSWPYMSVAPRKYVFRMLDGCNGRFLNLWLSSNPATGSKDGPKITILSTEGGFLSSPVTIDPKLGETLFLAPAERPMVIIDFTGLEGKTFTMMNDAAAPYPTGDPVIPGLTDRIMQFVVNGKMISAVHQANQGKDKGKDMSKIPTNLRPSNALVKLTDFKGGIALGVKIAVKRQLLLNEIAGEGGPLMVAVNNSHFDEQMAMPGVPYSFGGPTEIPREGTTEIWQIINTTMDAHPMHPHLVQWQLVSRQAFDATAYMEQAWIPAWQGRGIPNYPTDQWGDYSPYPGGAGSPNPYNTLNSDGAVGGNPAIKDYLTGPIIPASPEEQGWKDAVKALPGQVSTFIVRFAPTDKPINAKPEQLIFPFDPSVGPGYVWHCHIIDHEDMDMMRPLMIKYAPIRNIPVMNCAKSDIKKADDPKNSFYTVKGTDFDATATMPKGQETLTSLTYSLSGATKGTGTTLDGVRLNVGINTITWTAVNDDGLIAKCLSIVLVIPNSKCKIIIPNGFSPNGDGINDYFVIGCMDDYPNAILTVYNRSNRMVFRQNQYGNVAFWGDAKAWWDGTGNINSTGTKLPSGTYIYILDLDNGNTDLIKKGTVYLSR